jgi:hypothetical protein
MARCSCRSLVAVFVGICCFAAVLLPPFLVIAHQAGQSMPSVGVAVLCLIPLFFTGAGAQP